MNNFSLLLCKHMKVCSKQHILSKRKESESARNVMKTICVFQFNEMCNMEICET